MLRTDTGLEGMPRPSPAAGWALAIALLALAAGCSKDKDIDRPAELVKFPATVKVDHLWSAHLSGDKKPMRLGLGVAVQDGRVYAAGHAGDLAAFDLATGHRLWETHTKAPLAGGPGATSDLVAIGSTRGDVFAVNAADGKVRWHVAVGGEILAPPAITAKLVVVRTVDGKLHGLDIGDGHDEWQLEQQVPRLSLRGTSRPEIVGDLAICGFDNGKVVAANLIDGSNAWEAVITPPHGRTELERLVDIDSAALSVGNDVYVAGFQGRVAMLALDSGQIWWSHDLWHQKALAHRGLSTPALTHDAVVVADFQGYVHWLDKATGAVIGRERSGKVRISNPPVAVDDRVVVINDTGSISVFRTKPVSGRAAPAAAPAAPAAPEATAPAAPEEAPAAPEDKSSAPN
jgi:outer membrane protein assembly factor BamB